MPIPEPVNWTVAGLMAGWEYREQIGSIWSAITRALRLRKCTIAMTGLSGAGKSTLLDDFAGETAKLGYQPPSPSLKTDPGNAGKHLDRPAKILAVPGANAAFRQASLNEVFVDGTPVSGIIHVVSNGFPKFRQPEAINARISAGQDTVAHLQSEVLKEEVADFQEVSRIVRQHYATHRRPLFVSVLVNKYDLWSADPDPVRSQYEVLGGSAFSDALQDLRSRIGTDNVQICCDPVSAWPEPFEWNGVTVPSSLSRENRDLLTARYLMRLRDMLQASEQAL